MSTAVREIRRIVHHKFGDPRAVLKVEARDSVPMPGPGQMLVQVGRSIIHPGDLQLIAARYSDPNAPIPGGRVPGLEAAGVVAALGPGVADGPSIGARVIFFAPGAWQTHALVPTNAVVELPSDLPDEIATQLLVNTITARHVLRTGLNGLKRRPDHLLQTGAASSVGRLITVFALQLGLIPIRLVRSVHSAVRLRSALPGGHVIDTVTHRWRSDVLEAAGRGITLAVDGVGGAMIGELAMILEPQGRAVLYGLLGHAPSDLTRVGAKALSLIGATIGTYDAETSAEDVFADRMAAITVGRERPELFAEHRTYPLSALDDAIRAAAAPDKVGNILLAF